VPQVCLRFCSTQFRTLVRNKEPIMAILRFLIPVVLFLLYRGPLGSILRSLPDSNDDFGFF